MLADSQAELDEAKEEAKENLLKLKQCKAELAITQKKLEKAKENYTGIDSNLDDKYLKIEEL